MENKYDFYRQKHSSLIYHNFFISDNKISFHFSIDEFDFKPEWRFSLPLYGDISLFAFNLGMAELISYWKCACPKFVEIKCGKLDDWQTNWWKKLYKNGLGEFFYRNGINAGDDFMQIISSGKPLPKPENRELNGCLIPVGGGKDSVVTMELLKKLDTDNLCYIINPRGPVLETAYIAGFTDEKIIKVNRTIDKELLRLNSLGYLNGHTPFSSIIAFSGVLFAYLSGKKYLTLSNESSANEASISGTSVNHQYSKSAEFESDFREYSSRVFGDSLNTPEYFSFLRPWSEWQITKKFTSYPQYLNVFQSCNVGSKTDTWCGKCAKCLYVYIMLSAFLDDEKLSPVFGGNMLDKPELEPIFNGLVYDDYDKPFECVGTKNEVNLALHQALKQRRDRGKIPCLLQLYEKKPAFSPPPLDDFFDKNNFLPDEFLKLLKQ